MTFEKYVNRFLNKLTDTVEYYGKCIYTPVATVEKVTALQTQEHYRMPPCDAEMSPITPGTPWGEEYGNLWLKATVTVPQEAQGRILCACPDVEAYEILCFRNGVPVGQINSKDPTLVSHHVVMFVDSCAKAGEQIELAFECYAGHYNPGCAPYEDYMADEAHPDPAQYAKVYKGMTLYVLDEAIRDATFDLATVLQLAQLPEDNYVSEKAYECLKDAAPYIIQDIRDATPEEIRASAPEISRCLAPVLQKSAGDASRGLVGVIGHSHMDTAWLWPVSETIRKCARTYSQVLTLMDMYPEYNFIQSSALHLDWMRRYYPAVFEGICRRVKEGRYEPNGGVWVECDCNVTGGEAMARQFLYGQRFTRQYLDYTSDCFWLPDTFGYNGNIPQIMRQSGVKYFYTTKLSWNDLNTFPAGTFVWKGIDGSDVICHLNSTHSVPDPKTINSVYTKVTDRRTEDGRLAAYGYGDGGGGPTWSMQEFLKRVRDLPGMPAVEPMTVSAFMQHQEERRDRLPVFDGELYLELHRGTLTKMHEVKRNNRLAEIALHDLDLLCALTGQAENGTREDFWKILMKNQFHDILPGTCIKKVYDTEIPEMNKLIADVRNEAQACAAKLAQPEENTVSLLNTLSFDRDELAVLDGDHGVEGCETQVYTDQQGKVHTAVQVHLPAMQAACLHLIPAAATREASAFEVTAEADGRTRIVTPYYTAVMNGDGALISLIDRKEEREIRRDGGLPLGTLLCGEAVSAYWDNWDIDDDGMDKLRPVTAKNATALISNGPLELRFRTVYPLGRRSSCTVDTVFYAHDRRIDCECTVDWQERHGLLKVAYDTEIRTAAVKSEIQFGSIDRPTTRNNSIEAARFEICNHKWSDLSETRYGVSLLNDCKYGLSVDGSCMALTLMKGGTRPDYASDFGLHFMRWSLLPHTGAFSTETTVRPAYAFNYLPVVIPGRVKLPELFSIQQSNILCEAVKPAEDTENAVVLRLYECERSRTRTGLKLHCKQAWLTNFLEEKQEELHPDAEGNVTLNFRPYEIKTVLMKL